jgi:hypothetical protein
MRERFGPWLIARVVFLVLVVWGGLAGGGGSSTLTWLAVVIYSVGAGLLVVICMSFMAYRADIDWSDSYSLTKPLFQMTRYPIRFWFFVLVIAFSGGLASSAHDLFVRGHISPESALYLLSGLSILIGLLPWLLRHANSEKK